MWVLFVRVYRGGGGVVLVVLVRFIVILGMMA